LLSEPLDQGYGGVTAVARATGISRRAIMEGCKELKAKGSSPAHIPSC